MNTRRITTSFCSAAACLLILASHSWAALPIDLELAKEHGVPLAAPQEWARLLGRMNLGGVRIRDARGPERATVEQRNIGKTPRYRVVAILTGRNELVLPDRRFRMTERSALQKYFEQLPEQAAYTAEERGKFGLTKKQFEDVFAQLSQPVGFSTVKKTAKEILELLDQKISTPFVQEDASQLRRGKPLTAELKSLTLGTALAIALRQDGFMFVPEQLPGQSLRLTVEPYDAATESWPIGWKPAVSSRQSAPQLFEKRNIEIKGFTLTQALTALQPAIQLPIIMDEVVLRREQIDPNTVQVELRKRRTFLKSALGRMASQARLSEELRVDEQDQPFLWVTRFGKDSPRATK